MDGDIVVDEICAPVASVQVEYHPFLDQSATLAYLRERKIPLTAYAPLAQGRAAEDETPTRLDNRFRRRSATRSSSAAVIATEDAHKALDLCPQLKGRMTIIDETDGRHPWQAGSKRTMATIGAESSQLMPTRADVPPSAAGRSRDMGTADGAHP
jgi:Aldo/keto reductase family